MHLKKFVIIFLVIAILFSCSVTPKVKQIYDESLLLEQTSRISAGNAGTIISYNGITVNWKNKNLILPDMIQIQAGDTLLEWNIESRWYDTVYTGKNILFRYNFQPMKQYLFIVGKNEDKWGFNIFAYDFDEKIPSNMYNEEHFVGFVSFLNTD